MSEIQVYELRVPKDKAEAVFEAIKTTMQTAKSAGKIYSASCTRSTTERVEI